MERVWGHVLRNGGAAGIDRITLADVEQYGPDRLLAEQAADFRAERDRLLPGLPGLDPGARLRRTAAALDPGGP